MVTNRFAASMGITALGGLLATASVSGIGTPAARTTYLTVNTPIALPGVALGPGTYLFELAAPDERLDVVRVSSRDRSQVFFMGFTEVIDRPAGLRSDHPIAFGESRLGTPRPIAAWFPPNESTGRRFLYARTTRQVTDSSTP